MRVGYDVLNDQGENTGVDYVDFFVITDAISTVEGGEEIEKESVDDYYEDVAIIVKGLDDMVGVAGEPDVSPSACRCTPN